MLQTRTGTLQASNYIVNLVEFQNVITNASGLTPLTVLSNQVQNIASMVDYDLKRIYVNSISNYNQTPISILNDINLSNSLPYSNGVLFTTGSGGANTFVTSNLFGGVTLAAGTTSLTLLSSSTTNPLVSLSLGGSNVFTVQSNGDTAYVGGGQFIIKDPGTFAIGKNAAPGLTLNCIDLSGNSEWGYVSTLGTADTIRFLGTSKELGRFTNANGYFGIGTQVPQTALDVVGDASISGRVNAFDFLSLSDRRFKTNITVIENPSDILRKIRGVRFMWRDLSFNDIGVIAQEVQETLPEAVQGTEVSSLKLSVAYHKIIPVLIEVVKGLEDKVSTLQGQQGQALLNNV